MIVRIWDGCVKAMDAPEYLRLMREIALPNYRSVEGNQGAWCLHRREDDLVHVRMVSHWANLDAIRSFAGEDYNRALFYDFDKGFLLEFPKTVVHWELEHA